jgi:hypothetical protein
VSPPTGFDVLLYIISNKKFEPKLLAEPASNLILESLGPFEPPDQVVILLYILSIFYRTRFLTSRVLPLDGLREYLSFGKRLIDEVKSS